MEKMYGEEKSRTLKNGNKKRNKDKIKEKMTNVNRRE